MSGRKSHKRIADSRVQASKRYRQQRTREQLLAAFAEKSRTA